MSDKKRRLEIITYFAGLALVILLMILVLDLLVFDNTGDKKKLLVTGVILISIFIIVIIYFRLKIRKIERLEMLRDTKVLPTFEKQHHQATRDRHQQYPPQHPSTGRKKP